MRFLYDRMASLQFPLAPDRTHVLGGQGGNVVSYADLIEVARLDWLLARKTPHAVSSPAGRKRLVKPLRDFLVLYRTIIDDHFHPDLFPKVMP